MNESKNPGQVSAYLDEWTFAQLKEFAVAEDRTVSWVVGFALKQFFVARQANAADVSAALKRDPSPDYGKLSGRQVDIETAIAAVVKRGPVKPAKHK